MRDATQVMTDNPIVVRPGADFESCANTMRVLDIRHLVVTTAGGKLAGLLPDTAVFERGRFDDAEVWVNARPDIEATIAGAVQPVEALGPNTSLPDLLHRLLDSESDVVVMVDEGRVPVGIFTEYDALVLAARELPSDLKIRDVMATSIVTVEPETPLTEAFADMEINGIRHLPVRDRGALLGVISVRDLLWAGASVLGGGTVRSCLDAGRPLITASPESSLRSAAQRMADCKIGCMPVLGDDGSLEGIVTASDTLKALLNLLHKSA